MAVSQNFSMSMLSEMQMARRQKTDQLLAIAPSFPGSNAIAERNDRAVLGELLFNEDEAAAVLRSFDGRLVADQQATKARFLELAAQYQIYHIASHAVVDDEKPNNSYIAFSTPSDSNSNYSRLYSYEILAQSFPADLVVLSACETGVGRVVRGEGIMSLARAFSYAGARSLVTSLWNINDQSGQALMAEFYRHLSDGLTKDEALRQAKLSYLENAPDNARTHPRYWAAFVPTGNMESLTGSRTWQWAILAFVLLGSFYFFFLRKKNRY
jgi:CHAT domain-containing protein